MMDGISIRIPEQHVEDRQDDYLNTVKRVLIEYGINNNDVKCSIKIDRLNVWSKTTDLFCIYEYLESEIELLKNRIMGTHIKLVK